MKIGQNRRGFLQKVGIGARALLIDDTLLAEGSSPKTQDPSTQKFREEKLNPSTKWDKTFPKGSGALHRKVAFHNRYGITLAADLYLSKNLKGSKLLAIALSGPFGAVKGQSSGLYAQTLAENGFITLALDSSFAGESGGLPHFVASPSINTEDFNAALDFLSLYPNVDSSKISIVGTCGFGGFAINAAADDPRVKATLASMMYDMTRVYAKGYFDRENSKGARNKKRKELAGQRLKDCKSGMYALAGGVIDPLPSSAPEFVKDYHAYCGARRGYHQRSLNSDGGWNRTSMLSFLNMPILVYSDEIESAVFLIHGEKAHSRYFSEDAYKRLKGKSKELFIVKNASHTDLYDRIDIILFARTTVFFKQHLT